ncbi:MAG: hypothetical protein WA154_04605 [Moraxellaceae bacterium]
MTVQRRQVFYIAGFDHRGAAHYHSLYQNHAHTQAKNTDYQLTVADPQSVSAHQLTWQIDYQDQHGSCQTDYSYLVWDDITRAEMKPLGLDFYSSCLDAFVTYIRSGFLKNARQHAWPFAFCMTAAYGVVLTSPWAAVAVIALMVSGKVSWWLGLIALALLWMLLRWTNQKLNVMWLAHGFSFSVRHASDESLMAARLDEFAQTIVQAVQSKQYDEVMVIGHCYGSALLTPVMARVTTALADQPNPTALSVISLAQTSPLLSWLPQAKWYKKYMQQVDLSKLTWVDFSSPADGVCFPKLDIFANAGVNQPNALILKSPRFFKLFDAKEYQRIIRKNKFRIHFQYLLSSKFTQEYDFFAMTAGTKSLATQLAAVSSAVKSTDQLVKVDAVHV